VSARSVSRRPNGFPCSRHSAPVRVGCERAMTTVCDAQPVA
jgi:hypothetical protein